MYIHYTGYLLNNNNKSNHNGSIPYTLSTESLFSYELLDSYLASITAPTVYSNNNFFNLHLMRYFSYFTSVKSPIPFGSIFRLTYKNSEENDLVYHFYKSLLSTRY